MKIQTNTSASFALNYMSVNEKNTQQSIQRLSSGFRINKAGDDAAGLAIANKLRSDTKGLGQAQKNVAQASSMLQVMDGATQTVSSILDRMKELSTQANSANIGTQSGQLQKEFTQLSGEIDRIAATTNYQGTKLLDGSFGSGAGKLPPTPAGATTPVEIGAGSLLKANMSSTDRVASATVTNSALFNGNVAFTQTPYTAAVAAVAADPTATPPVVGSAAVPAVPMTITATMTLADGTTRAQTVTPAAAGAGTLAFDKLGFSLSTGSGFKIADATASNNGFATGTTLKQVDAGTGSFQVSSSGSYAFGGNDQIQVKAVNVSSAGLGLTGLDLTTQDGAAAALTALDTATNTVSTALGSIGSSESRLDFASTNVATALQNTQAAESTIRDTDMAAEMTSFTKNNILQQAAQSMLSQANQGTQGILTLLRG